MSVKGKNTSCVVTKKEKGKNNKKKKKKEKNNKKRDNIPELCATNEVGNCVFTKMTLLKNS